MLCCFFFKHCHAVLFLFSNIVFLFCSITWSDTGCYQPPPHQPNWTPPIRGSQPSNNHSCFHKMRKTLEDLSSHILLITFIGLKRSNFVFSAKVRFSPSKMIGSTSAALPGKSSNLTLCIISMITPVHDFNDHEIISQTNL